ncbi:MAG TPA: macro domain-containing protein, partial [Candidatus Bathyarchaeota archaeon]|nr:macro domain-containing protein [Candidatus Bathyarchaeota archaeon]
MDVVYKGVRVRVLRGDITEVDAEAIVNPANSLL